MSAAKPSSRPDAVQVFGKRVKILYVQTGDERLRDSPRDKKPGIARNDTDKQEIYITDGLPLETEQEAIWHEIKHCIEQSMGLDLPEEAFSPMDTGEISVFKANVKLLSYLRRRA